jgi:hypothetical protein
MVNRIIGGAMLVVMASLGAGITIAVLETAKAERLNDGLQIAHHLNTIEVELAALVIVAALYSITKRLAAIEARLNDR